MINVMDFPMYFPVYLSMIDMQKGYRYILLHRCFLYIILYAALIEYGGLADMPFVLFRVTFYE